MLLLSIHLLNSFYWQAENISCKWKLTNREITIKPFTHCDERTA